MHVARDPLAHGGRHRHLDGRIERGESPELVATLDADEHGWHPVVGAHVGLEVPRELGRRKVEREDDTHRACGARRDEVFVKDGVGETWAVPDLSTELAAARREVDGL